MLAPSHARGGGSLPVCGAKQFGPSRRITPRQARLRPRRESDLPRSGKLAAADRKACRRRDSVRTGRAACVFFISHIHQRSRGNLTIRKVGTQPEHGPPPRHGHCAGLQKPGQRPRRPHPHSCGPNRAKRKGVARLYPISGSHVQRKPAAVLLGLRARPRSAQALPHSLGGQIRPLPAPPRLLGAGPTCGGTRSPTARRPLPAFCRGCRASRRLS